MSGQSLDGFGHGVERRGVQEDEQCGVAQEHEAPDDPSVAGADLVLGEQRVPAPVRPVLDGPVAADEGLPLGVGALGGLEARDVAARLAGGPAGLLAVRGAAHGDERAAVREAGLAGAERLDADGARLRPAVAAQVELKKGARPSAARAFSSSLPWLALTWSRYSPSLSTISRAVSFWQWAASPETVAPASPPGMSASAP